MEQQEFVETEEVGQDTINTINNKYLNNSGKKLEKIFKITKGVPEGKLNHFKNYFAIIKTPGIACSDDINADYSNNKQNTIDSDIYMFIDLSAKEKNQAIQVLENFFGKKQTEDNEKPKNIVFISNEIGGRGFYKDNKFNYIQMNYAITTNVEATAAAFLKDKEKNYDEKKKSYQNIITDKQDNLQEMLKSLMQESHYLKNDIISKKSYFNTLCLKMAEKANKKVVFNICHKDQDGYTIGAKEITYKQPFTAMKHKPNIGNEKVLYKLQQELYKNIEDKKKAPLSKIKSKKMKDIIFNDEFRKFCIDNDIDVDKEEDLSEEQKKEFLTRLNEAEHNYPCDVNKILIDEEKLNKLYDQFSQEFNKKVYDFLKQKCEENIDIKEAIEKYLKDDKNKCNENTLVNLATDEEFLNGAIYENILNIKRETAEGIEDLKDIRSAFGFDKAVFDIKVDRENKGKANKTIKKLFLSNASQDKTDTKDPLNINIQIMSGYQMVLGNNQMKMYGKNTMEDANQRGYITGEQLSQKYESLAQKISKSITDPNKQMRSHNALNFYDTEGGQAIKTPFSTTARIRYFFTNPISDNHINNYFYKIGIDENKQYFVKEMIPFDYDKENKKDIDNIKQHLEILSDKGNVNMGVLPWLFNKKANDNTSFNIKEELDIFLKEIHRIITIEPSTMFDIIAYRLQLTGIDVQQNLHKIYNVFFMHTERLEGILKAIRDVVGSLTGVYHQNNEYKEFCSKLKYIVEKMLPEKIQKWKDISKYNDYSKNKKQNDLLAKVMEHSFKENLKELATIKKDIADYDDNKYNKKKEITNDNNNEEIENQINKKQNFEYNISKNEEQNMEKMEKEEIGEKNSNNNSFDQKNNTPSNDHQRTFVNIAHNYYTNNNSHDENTYKQNNTGSYWQSSKYYNQGTVNNKSAETKLESDEGKIKCNGCCRGFFNF